MDAALFEEIFNRLDVADLTAEVADTVLAACHPEETLEKLLSAAGFVTPANATVVAEVKEPSNCSRACRSLDGPVN